MLVMGIRCTFPPFSLGEKPTVAKFLRPSEAIAGADPLSLNYPDFEQAVLSFLKEVKVEDITPDGLH